MLSFKQFLTEFKNPSSNSTKTTRELRDKVNIQKKGRYELVKARIRNKTVQRNRKISSTKGYEFKKGHLTKMSSLEKRHRKLGARHAKIKRRAHLRNALMKRKISLRKRHSIGL